jgi:hypothetical protein
MIMIAIRYLLKLSPQVNYKQEQDINHFTKIYLCQLQHLLHRYKLEPHFLNIRNDQKFLLHRGGPCYRVRTYGPLAPEITSH